MVADPSSKDRDDRRSRRRRGAGAWFRRLGGGLLAILLALAGIGLAYQAVATAADAGRYPPPGRLVDIGGRRLHLLCAGAPAGGGPTVVLEQGGGGQVLAWHLVQAALAPAARVCAYDRAGQGWSDPGPEPRDGAHIAEDLHALLTRAGEPGPYLLVGHSYGGPFVRAYANRYPDEVAGLVLLDATHEEVWTGSPEGRARYEADSRLYAIARVLVRFGLLRLGPNPFAEAPPAWPEALRAPWRALANGSRMWDATEAESRAIGQTMAQLRAAPPLPASLPLAVVTAGLNQGVDGRWRAYQAELAALSANSEHVVVDGASHEALWADPRYAPASVAAVLRSREAARSGKALAGP